MIANYHTHTHRCNHAIGREEDYVKEALKAGLQILGWADHTPYLFPNGYYSHFRMRPVQLLSAQRKALCGPCIFPKISWQTLQMQQLWYTQ